MQRPGSAVQTQAVPARPPSPGVSAGRADVVGVAALTPVLTEILSALDEIRARLAGSHKPWLTVEEVADLTGRSDYTIRRWVKEGKLDAVRLQDTGPRGRLLIAHDQLRRLTDAGLGSRISDVHAG
jgi:excisionase family DNA binding protein